ncbi:glutamyl-tRNA amidotransferase [Erysipelothrix larvae]|uniref:Aspartyl/glutamyl-tRNA(Asn/Gln) amidotransferase subunit B n=1 Tax=Erysipelothrix larvae TaxID=1514105 RepID=A0A0X8GYA4_9FIRM|nr:Asp-tRNA(Asn)/Glu-tRNA(Gln) amidotransferase subunit GatB [Erysipelothrix larvae]AMC92647.1 glutamyl-tRNA amidotransferase [Erysipelothrix larvae]
MNYEAVVGIEIHCELKTETKMFSGAPLSFGGRPNTAINEIDLAYPGTLPQVNKKAVQFGVRLCKALKCEIDPVLTFDRKNYYYSDLPKGYQITQQEHPIGKNGVFDIYVGDTLKTIRINRLHLEEDTAKQFHEGDKTLIDFNRAGTPLVEIVTEADFRTPEEAAAYVEGIRMLVVYLGVSDGRMSDGSLRCDVNVSIRPIGVEAFGTKVEVKNLNSISNVQKALEYELKRQEEVLNRGEKVVSETRRFDEKTQTTQSMRLKETAVDYRYFTEPNITPIRIPQEMFEEPWYELPSERITRYIETCGLSEYDADVLTRNKELADYFDQISVLTSSYKLAVNWITQDLLAVVDHKGEQTLDSWITPKHFVEFLDAIESKTISSKQAKDVFVEMQKGLGPKEIIKKKGMVQVSDEAILLGWIQEVLDANPQAVEDYKNGLDRAQKFVMGQVMKLSKGQANPQVTNKLVVSELAKR